MDPAVKIAIYHAVEKEPFARALSMELKNWNWAARSWRWTTNPS